MYIDIDIWRSGRAEEAAGRARDGARDAGGERGEGSQAGGVATITYITYIYICI